MGVWYCGSVGRKTALRGEQLQVNNMVSVVRRKVKAFGSSVVFCYRVSIWPLHFCSAFVALFRESRNIYERNDFRAIGRFFRNYNSYASRIRWMLLVFAIALWPIVIPGLGHRPSNRNFIARGRWADFRTFEIIYAQCNPRLKGRLVLVSGF